MLDVCKGLYNVIVNIECRNDNVKSTSCMRTDCDSFKQMCYLYNLNKNNLGLSCRDLQLGKVDKDSLKCSCGQIGKEICQDLRWSDHKAIDMRLDEKQAECECDRFVRLNRDNQENLLFLLVLLMAMTLIFPDRNICLADLICAFDAEVLERRFSKMVYKFVCDIKNSLAGPKNNKQVSNDLHRITEFLNNLKTIYYQHDDISKQADHYLCHLYMGMEKCNKLLSYKDTTRMRIQKKLKKDNLANSLDAFLFSCEQTSLANIREKFFNNVAILKTLMIKCHEHYQMFSQAEMNTLLDALADYNCWEVDLIQIKGLERAKFATKGSFMADTKLVMDYLKKVDIVSKSQNARAEKMCWNTWEMALA